MRLLTWNDELASIEEAIAKGWMLEISREDRLYVHCQCRPEDKRFRAAFRKVWKAIPSAERDQIRSFLNIADDTCGRLYLEYSDCWSPRSRVYASATPFGNEIQFVASAIDPLRFRSVCFLIAHEVGHIFQKARGDRPIAADENGLPTLYKTAAGGSRTYEENEADADSIAERWGFPKLPFLIDELRLMHDPDEDEDDA